ncbi:MAG: TolC family protein [SAR324 cluster bacterium]|nr:TolC family protein [SAR324 cluster bacterium]
MTLKEALISSTQQGIDAPILLEQGQSLGLKREQLEKSKIKHTITGRTGYSKNEVGDSQDLAAGAIETMLYTLSYQQLYENGFSWTASQTTRSSKALTETEKDEEYSKQLLLAKLPLYGKTADITSLFNKKQQLLLETEQNNLQNDINALQSVIARAYFSAYLEAETYKISTQKLELVQKKVDIQSKTPRHITSLDLQLSQIELQREQITNEEQKIIQDQAFNKLEMLLGNQVEKELQLPLEMPTLKGSDQQVLEFYLDQSSKLSQLKNQLNILQQDAAISDSNTAADIYAVGFVGNTNVNETKGRNYGVNLTVTYNFGGGEQEQTSAFQKEIIALNLKLEKERRELQIQFQLDMSKFRSLSKQAILSEKEYQLFKVRHQLARQKFQQGEIGQETLTDLEIKLHNSLLHNIQSKIDNWLQFLSILEQTNQPLIDLL